MRPKVSIVMPVLNGERFIGEAIQSILAQTYKNFELIVIDDGSTDHTQERVRAHAGQLSLTLVHHESPRGIAPSMNDGLRNATGDMIAFLDHDDGWFPEFLETQVSYLETHPDIGMVHSDFQTTDVDGNVLEASVATSRRRTRPSGQVFPQLFLDSFIVGNSVLIRRECFDKLGLFDETLRWGDYHMWMRIARHYRVDYVGKVLTTYRQHSTQSTRSVSADAVYQEPVGLAAIKKIVESYPEVWQELGETAVKRRMARLYFDVAYQSWSSGAFRNARRSIGNAIGLWPTNARYRILWAATMLRPSHAMAIRSAWRKVRSVFSSAKPEHTLGHSGGEKAAPGSELGR